MSLEKTSADSNEIMVTRKEVAIGVQDSSVGGASENASSCTIANKADNVFNDNGDKDAVGQTRTNPGGIHEDATVQDVEKPLIEVGVEKVMPRKATKADTNSTDSDAPVLPSEEILLDASDKPAKEIQPISDPESRNRLKQSLSKHFTKKHPLSYLNSLDPKHDKYKAIIAQANSSEECTIYPDLEGEEKVALKKKELESLLRERPRPTEVYIKAAAIQAEIDSLVQDVKPKRAKVNSAMEILSESLGSLELCEKKVDFLGCVEWEKIYNAARKVLNDYLDHLLDKGLNAVAANKIRLQQQQRKLPLNNQGGKVEGTSGSSGDATVENVITSEGEKILTHPLIATEMEVDELLSKVSSSGDKKRSAKRRKKSKIGELISEADLAKALRAKWNFKRQSDGKTFGADNRLGHGLTRREGRLHCSLCDTPISCRGSISQHLSTAGHQARLSELGGKVLLPGTIITDQFPKKVAYVFEERFLWHSPWCVQYSPLVQPFEHWEKAETKRRFHNLLLVSELYKKLTHLKNIDAGTTKQLSLVHTASYIDDIKNKSGKMEGGYTEDDTTFSQYAFDIASLAVGGTIQAVDKVMQGEVGSAYVLCRPPGHHALPDKGMGFCIFNNIAIAAKHLLKDKEIGKVAIVDYDVHHGNGTEQIFYNDGNCLFISIHQDSNYPLKSGDANDIGSKHGKGTNINIPLPPGSGGGAYKCAFDSVVIPALHRFAPDFILVSSGFDASYADPLSAMILSSEDFRYMASSLVRAARILCNNRIVFVHEGGYSEMYVPFCGAAVIEAMVGVDPKERIKDPFLDEVKGWGGQDLATHQCEVIDRVAVLHGLKRPAYPGQLPQHILLKTKRQI